MPPKLLGKKIGMTRVYHEGVSTPVTAIQAGPCYVSQIKRPETDGYAAIQVAFEDVKPRRSTMPLIGHDGKAGLSPKRHHREFHVLEEELDGFELGQELGVDWFEGTPYVDVAGISKGKGFSGVMKRHNFGGHLASHGIKRKHRTPGAIAGHAAEAGRRGGIKKGKPMPGQQGNHRCTERSLDLVAVDKEKGLLLVKGPVPGPKQGLLEVRKAIRLYKRRKGKHAEAAAV